VPYVIPAQAAFQTDVRLFACYWLLAAAVAWATRQPRLGARVVGLDVVLIDMPFSCLLEWDMVAKNPTVAGLAMSSVPFYMLLVMAAAFSLQTWRIVLAAVVGCALQTLLLVIAPEGIQFAFWAIPSIGGVAAICVYNTRRTTRLVGNAAREQRRRERLGRYFSPQVAERVEELGEGQAAGMPWRLNAGSRPRSHPSAASCPCRRAFSGCSVVAHPAEILELRVSPSPRRSARFCSGDVQIVTPGGRLVALPVETENHGVGGSIPSLATCVLSELH
jgi:hypothetical protein